MSRRLAYAWAPGFYAQVERAQRPELSDRPVLVGGDPRKRGVVLAATADARAAGVVEGMPVLEALERCPRARALRTQMASYREAAKRLRACLASSAEKLEPEGLGAAFLEFGPGADPLLETTRALGRTVLKKLGISVQIGVAPVRFVAKLAAQDALQGEPRIVPVSEVAAFLGPLPVDRLPGVGPNTAERLAALGARTARDVVGLGREPLERALGNHGLAIWAAACGQGSDRVRAARHPRSISQETTLPRPERDRTALGEVLEILAERLARQLELEGLRAARLVLKLRYGDGEGLTRSRSSDQNLSSSRQLLAMAEELLERTDAGSRPVRLIGLAATRLAPGPHADRQLALFPSGE